ncbi:MAG: glycoside hydrolase [Prevotellaceae bacterium]|nr:glycoside hydrolase [Prevotellaceae bacterium]
MLNKLLSSFIFVLCCSSASAQIYTSAQQQDWLKKAEECKPSLHKTIHHPVQEVEIVKDANAFQGYKAVRKGNIADLYSKSFKEKKSIVVDFGEHLVGNVSFKIKDIGSMQDAIIRFKVTFGEVPSDLALPIEPFTGGLSRGWLQDFVCDVSYDGTFSFNRRITARYMKIEAVGTSVYSDFCFDHITFEATTSAGKSQTQLASTTPQIFKDIARVSENTLRDCMQGVFEDGPKRDQRLWMGDLYLQALANEVSFKEFDLTKRCLYLLAGLSNPQNGLLYSNMVEYPRPHAQQTFFVDYALSYVLTLADYLDATDDKVTANDLWIVAKRQVEAVLEEAIDKDNLYSNTGYQFKGMMMSIVFFDWAPVTLDTHAAIQGYLPYVIDRCYDIAEKLGKTDEVKNFPSVAKKLRSAGKKAYWDSKKKMIVSGPDKQTSYTCTSWAVLGDLVNAKEAREAIKNVMADKNAITPGTPYANHFLVAAMLHCGMNEEARQYVEDYWGGMVRLGADTFWEYYVPDNHLFSSYNGYTLLNSYCHAWSCTPIYFIVKYPEIFQK